MQARGLQVLVVIIWLLTVHGELHNNNKSNLWSCLIILINQVWILAVQHLGLIHSVAVWRSRRGGGGRGVGWGACNQDVSVYPIMVRYILCRPATVGDSAWPHSISELVIKPHGSSSTWWYRDQERENLFIYTSILNVFYQLFLSVMTVLDIVILRRNLLGLIFTLSLCNTSL